jgi:hypothetical protein
MEFGQFFKVLQSVEEFGRLNGLRALFPTLKNHFARRWLLVNYTPLACKMCFFFVGRCRSSALAQAVTREMSFPSFRQKAHFTAITDHFVTTHSHVSTIS